MDHWTRTFGIWISNSNFAEATHDIGKGMHNEENCLLASKNLCFEGIQLWRFEIPSFETTRQIAWKNVERKREWIKRSKEHLKWDEEFQDGGCTLHNLFKMKKKNHYKTIYANWAELAGVYISTKLIFKWKFMTIKNIFPFKFLTIKSKR